MNNSPSPQRPKKSGEFRFRPTWMFRSPGPPRGLSLAREKRTALIWDDSQWLSLVDTRGRLQGQVKTPWPIVATGAAEDGSVYAVAGAEGSVWWLAPDLSVRWQTRLPRPITAVALDAFGNTLAVADRGAGVHRYDATGQIVWETQTVRPLHHLVFVPEVAQLLGAADFGVVVGLNERGETVWRDGLVVHIGSLATNTDGSMVVLACFSEGLRRYSAKGEKKGSVALMEPCRLAALNAAGNLILVAGRAARLLLLNQTDQIAATHDLDALPTALALSALGEWALVALQDGQIVALEIQGR